MNWSWSDVALRRLLDRLRTLLGETGRATDRAVTFEDLVQLGLVERHRAEQVAAMRRPAGR